MPDYSKLREMVSHRVTVEYDTGARIVGYLETCRPGQGDVQLVKLTGAKIIDSAGNTMGDVPSDLWLCPNVLMGFYLEEGPLGRDV